MSIKYINKAIKLVYDFSATKNFPHTQLPLDSQSYYEKALKAIDHTGLPETRKVKGLLSDSPDAVEQYLWHYRYVHEGLVKDTSHQDPFQPS